MKVAFRTDASLYIGTGHVMRCLTLADALKAKGAECHFISREHPGNLVEYINSKGYETHSLPMGSGIDADLAHSNWLGSSQADDMRACTSLLAGLRPEWLIVDHYALDFRWENALSRHVEKLMVIDDLADRKHASQVLLDQTLGRNAHDYKALVPADCTLLCGSDYALLREEFAAMRQYSLKRRATAQLRRLLVTMGGADKDNATSKVLAALRQAELPRACEITVVMGLSSPWLSEVEEQARVMSWPTRVYVGVNNMAQLIADSDLAIGAAGATSWERCCLGSPTLMVVLAENQRGIAQALSDAGAAVFLGDAGPTHHVVFSAANFQPELLQQLGKTAATLVDGLGTQRVTEVMAG